MKQYLFRIHIKPASAREEAFQYCLDQKLLGAGWRVDTDRHTLNWDEYKDLALKKHGKKEFQNCEYIHKWVTEGSLVWTRSPKGEYYLAKVKSSWEYFTTPESIKSDIDIANIFRVVDFIPIEIDSVPGKVVASFRPSRTIQEIYDQGTHEFSKYLWNQKSGSDDYAVDFPNFIDIFNLLNDKETEDLVYLYLQNLGWYILPNSRNKDSIAFEYMAVNPKTKKIAGTQVKTGKTPLDAKEYSQYRFSVFLFQSNDLVHGSLPETVTWIKRSDLEQFLHKSDWLPEVFRLKLEMITKRN